MQSTLENQIGTHKEIQEKRFSLACWHIDEDDILAWIFQSSMEMDHFNVISSSFNASRPAYHVSIGPLRQSSHDLCNEEIISQGLA